MFLLFLDQHLAPPARSNLPNTGKGSGCDIGSKFKTGNARRVPKADLPNRRYGWKADLGSFLMVWRLDWATAVSARLSESRTPDRERM